MSAFEFREGCESLSREENRAEKHRFVTVRLWQCIRIDNVRSYGVDFKFDSFDGNSIWPSMREVNVSSGINVLARMNSALSDAFVYSIRSWIVYRIYRAISSHSQEDMISSLRKVTDPAYSNTTYPASIASSSTTSQSSSFTLFTSSSSTFTLQERF